MIRALIAVLFVLCGMVSCPAEETGVLPDAVSVNISKKGNAPATISVKVGDKTTTLKEGEWEKVPAEAKPYIDRLFSLKKPAAITISLDCSEAAETKEWGENAVREAEKWYPKLVELLDSDGFQPATTATIRFKKMDGVAYASGGTITISADWIAKHPDDVGMVIHELIHIVQAYRSKVPGWVTEGIADYIRFFVYEKNGEKTCRVNPDRAKYTDSYRTTGAFFDWIVRTYDPKFITTLNAKCREGKYSDDVFKTATGKTLDELWNEFITSLKK